MNTFLKVIFALFFLFFEITSMFKKKAKMGNSVSEQNEVFATCEKLSFDKCIKELKLLPEKKYNIHDVEHKVQTMNTWRVLNSFPIEKMTINKRKLFNQLEAKRRNVTLWILYAEKFSR